MSSTPDLDPIAQSLPPALYRPESCKPPENHRSNLFSGRDRSVQARERNQRPYRAKQIADWIYEKRVNSFEEMTDLPQDLRNRLAEEFAFGGVETVRVLGSEDTTRKFFSGWRMTISSRLS